MKMILNPNIIVFEHTECILLFNQKNKNVYKIGIKEYHILLHFLNSDGKKEDLFFESENLRTLFNNFTKNSILVEENYIEPKIKEFIKSFALVKDKKHINIYRKFPEVVLYLFVPIFLICIIFVYINFDEYKAVFDLFKEHTVYTIVILEFAILFATFVHEIWHVLIAHNESADVPQIGVKFAYVVYWFYVKIIGISLLKKQSKIKIYIAGIASNLFFGSVILLVAWLFRSIDLIFLTLVVLGTVNIILALLNVLFILKLDGNYILEEVLEMEDLNRNVIRFFLSKKNHGVDVLTKCVYIMFGISSFFLIVAFVLTSII